MRKPAAGKPVKKAKAIAKPVEPAMDVAVGRRIRDLRRIRQFSLETVAARTELSIGFLAAFAAAGLRILLPPLTSNRFLHVHENRLRHSRKCDQIFILVKIGRNGSTRNVCDHDICERRVGWTQRGMR